MESEHQKNNIIGIIIIIFLCLIIAILIKKQQEDKIKNAPLEIVFTPTIDKIEIEIEGLPKDQTFIYLTDMHTIIKSEKELTKEEAELENRQQHFVNSQGILASDQFSYWIEYANKNKLDAVLFGGDMIDYPSEENIQFLATQISNLKSPYLYTLGNHDWTFPWHYFDDTAKNTYQPLLSSYMKENIAVSSLELEGVTILSIDNSQDNFNPESLTKVKEVLSKNTPVIVMFHVPLEAGNLLESSKEKWGKSIVIGKEGLYPNPLSEQIIQMIKSDKSPVIAVLAGHIHIKDSSPLTERITQYVSAASYEGVGTEIHLKAK